MDSQKAVQFRKWATDIIEEYTVKGFAMDEDRVRDSLILQKVEQHDIFR